LSDSDKLLEASLDFVNAVESACVNFKRYVAKEKGVEEKPSWDSSKIEWTQAEGSKGAYERSEDVNNLQFKAMLKDLASHSGKMQRNGYFYWTFQNGSTVGRKRRK